MKNIEKVKDLYEKGCGVVEIGKMLNMYPSNVAMYLNKIYGKDRVRDRHIVINRKYKLNDKYFKKIDSEDKSYFLGLLYANGCISSTSNAVQISLQEEDKYILEQFSVFIESTKPLRLLKGGKIKGFKEAEKEYYRRNQYIMVINSPRIKSQLLNLGITPNKSLTINFPHCIDEHLISHFIRGYFDGDGGIYGYSKNKWEVSIAGNKNFTEGLLNYLLSKGIKCRKTKHHKNNVYYVRITGRLNCIDLYNLMYSDSNIFLIRKYSKFQECINSTKNVRNGNSWKKED